MKRKVMNIEEELKNQDESVAKCNELIQEIVDRLNQDNKQRRNRYVILLYLEY